MAEKETKIGRLSSIKELGELGGDVKNQNGLAEHSGVWHDV